MRRPELSPRLEMSAGLVPPGARLADIGTDHAYLPAALILRGRIPSAIAADLRPGPLARARQTVREYGLEGRVHFRLCDGLSGISPGEADAAVIAGMGGETIAHILEGAPWARREGIPLILQPMSSMPDLREWLQKNGWSIAEERLAREGENLYTALLARAGEMEPMTPAQLWAGKNTHDPLRGEWLDRLLEKLDRALDGLGRARQEGAAVRRARLEQVRKGLLDMKEEWTAWQRQQ